MSYRWVLVTHLPAVAGFPDPVTVGYPYVGA
jgi:hypothetical protein